MRFKDYDIGDDLTEVARDFAMFRVLGIRTWRGSISWLEVEPQRGHFDVAWLDRFASLAADSGIDLRPYIDYTPAWAARPGGDTLTWHDAPADVSDWAAFVDTLARVLARHPNVRSLEVYNEENTTQWWSAPSAAYDTVLAVAAARVHAAAPRLQLILGGMVWPDARWATHACAAAAVDVVPFHAYPETWTPDSVTVESYLRDYGYAGFLTAERAHCRAAPVWINETGSATMPGRSIYFDRVSQVHMGDRVGGWTRGRVALVGDAAWCISLLGGQGDRARHDRPLRLGGRAPSRWG